MTLLYVATGNVNARCDAKCYDAHAKHCNCVCGGTNHGVGFDQAMQNTQEAFGDVPEGGIAIGESYAATN